MPCTVRHEECLQRCLKAEDSVLSSAAVMPCMGPSAVQLLSGKKVHPHSALDQRQEKPLCDDLYDDLQDGIWQFVQPPEILPFFACSIIEACLDRPEISGSRPGELPGRGY